MHTIAELGEISMLHDLSRAVGDLAAETSRHIHLVLENDDNAASLLDPDQDPPAEATARSGTTIIIMPCMSC